jgi:hypothetical protein
MTFYALVGSQYDDANLWHRMTKHPNGSWSATRKVPVQNVFDFMSVYKANLPHFSDDELEKIFLYHVYVNTECGCLPN